MKKVFRRVTQLLWMLLVVSPFFLGSVFLTPAAYAENQVMGEIQFEGKSHVEETSGVWVDGEYVGI